MLTLVSITLITDTLQVVRVYQQQRVKKMNGNCRTGSKHPRETKPIGSANFISIAD